MNKKQRGRQSLFSIADALKVGQKMSNEEGGLRRLFLPDLEITISSVSVGQLGGGDFHGIVHREKGRTAVFIGDISGHDLSCTIVATRVIEFIEEFEDEMMYPNLFLRKMAMELHSDMQSYGRFFTAALCMADVEHNQILYSSSGHPQSLLYSAADGTVAKLGRKSMPVGFEPEISFQLEQRGFNREDALLMFTDGISSARSHDKFEFGEDRIERVLLDNIAEPSNIVPKLVESVRAFTEGSGTSDDETVICIVRT